MTENEIIDDRNFREKCRNYGLDGDNFEIFQFDGNDYVISLYDPTGYIYILLDKNYNTICIEKCDWITSYEDLRNFVEDRYNSHCSLPSELPSFQKLGYPFEKFGYPFGNFSLKQIMDLSSRVEVRDTNHGHSLITRINGDWYYRKSQQHEDYFQLLSYVKFLAEEIEQYFILNYHMQKMGFEVPDVYSFTRALISKIDKCVNYYIKKNIRPFPYDILSYIGQNSKKLSFDGILYDVVELLLNDKGRKVKSDNINELEPVEIKGEKKDLSKIATSLLEILELSKDNSEKGKIKFLKNY